jgi:uncharacterized protein (TIGR02266 family)
MSQAGQGASVNPSDRRQSPRIRVELEVTFNSEHNFFLGLTENLSEGGLFIATHQTMPVGTRIDLKFKVPSMETPCDAKAIVRWVRHYSEDIVDTPGMGVSFISIDPAVLAAIRSFLKARAPIFYDS